MITLKRREYRSEFTTWEKMAAAHDWNVRTARRALRKYGEYKGYFYAPNEKVLVNVSIPCQELHTYLLFNLKQQTNNFNHEEDGVQIVVVTLGENDFTIKCEVTNRVVSELVSTDAAGFELSVDASEIEIQIEKVINQDGEVVVLDADTEELLLSKIEL